MVAATVGLAEFLQQLRRAHEAEDVTALEPDVDDRDVGNVGDAAQIREDEDLEQGAVLKATLEPGTGELTPKPGDLVFLHYSILGSTDGEVLQSTRAEHGGPNQPQPFVLGRGAARPLRGIELALATMTPRERCMLELAPAYAYLHKGCVLSPPPPLKPDSKVAVDVQLVAWHDGSGVHSVEAAPGVIKRVLKEGQGWETPRPPFEVTLRVEARAVASDGAQQGGRLLTTKGGTASVAPDERGGGGAEHFTCALGAGALPEGLDAAVCTMQRGEAAAVLCPAALAAGGTAVAPLGDEPPPYVEYTVQLLDFLQVRDLTGDGAAVKRILKKGRGEFPADCPLEDTAVRVHLKVKAAGGASWLYDSRAVSALRTAPAASDGGGAGDPCGAPLVLETGTGALPACLDSAARVMLRGEVAAVRSDWAHAYAGRTDVPAGLPEGCNVEFELELVDFEAEPNWAELDAAGKLSRAARWKEQGNAVFKAGWYRLARQKYLKGIRCVDQTLDIETQEQAAAAGALKLACLVNLAACAQREEEFGEAIGWCNKALSEDSEFAKAYFRRGVAQYHLGEYDAAREDLEEAALLDPGAAGDVERELARMAARARAAAGKQRRELGSFFDKARK